LLVENAAVCEPPLPPDEVRQVTRSVAQYPPAADEALNTDLANAVRLVSSHGRDLKYTPERGWLTWNGQRWCVDDMGEVMARAKAAARGIFDEAANADGDKQRTLTHWALNRSRSNA
jgi:hypothetical protein